mmetsp:Transcript_1433/g.2060  ORF Transcript_1433/g.2060 Transcript_1433/m.2060 type:complete len:128 (+) Transcript_1433:2-385(+)
MRFEYLMVSQQNRSTPSPKRKMVPESPLQTREEIEQMALDNTVRSRVSFKDEDDVIDCPIDDLENMKEVLWWSPRQIMKNMDDSAREDCFGQALQKIEIKHKPRKSLVSTVISKIHQTFRPSAKTVK